MKKKIKCGTCHKCGATPVQEVDTEEKTITARCERCGTVRVDREYVSRYGVPDHFIGEES